MRCGVKAAVNHLRVFGCLGYLLVPKEKRKKLDQKGIRCNKLWDPTREKFIISRDVIFDEDKHYTPEEVSTEPKTIMGTPTFIVSNQPMRQGTTIGMKKNQ
ncbi:hypothetical protein O6H91_08G075600 [Diphasiastrum complanatum]|uniref:Uncharacterized protein n=1 Tax=Diphasiastrum complanatum TaxID=34168 RepID=A0ACC2CYZ1_DIPCM|nr:hypothetical protein O6H91_08G075600 [Diphasiastrum complanatum]